MSNSKSSKKSTAVLVVLVIIAVLEYSIGYVLGNYTMASYPIVMCVSFLFAAIKRLGKHRHKYNNRDCFPYRVHISLILYTEFFLL